MFQRAKTPCIGLGGIGFTLSRDFFYTLFTSVPNSFAICVNIVDRIISSHSKSPQSCVTWCKVSRLYNINNSSNDDVIGASTSPKARQLVGLAAEISG